MRSYLKVHIPNCTYHLVSYSRHKWSSTSSAILNFAFITSVDRRWSCSRGFHKYLLWLYVVTVTFLQGIAESIISQWWHYLVIFNSVIQIKIISSVLNLSICNLPITLGLTSPMSLPGTSSVVTVISVRSGPFASKAPSSLSCAKFQMLTWFMFLQLFFKIKKMLKKANFTLPAIIHGDILTPFSMVSSWSSTNAKGSK